LAKTSLQTPQTCIDLWISTGNVGKDGKGWGRQEREALQSIPQSAEIGVLLSWLSKDRFDMT